MRRLAAHSKFHIPMATSHLSAGPAVEVTEDHCLLDVTALVTKGRQGFIAYEVSGDSMMESIPSGAVVFVDPYAEPKSGDIIAANVNGGICIKRLQISQRRLYLVANNSQYKPREIKESDTLQILGVVKGSLNLY